MHNTWKPRQQITRSLRESVRDVFHVEMSRCVQRSLQGSRPDRDDDYDYDDDENDNDDDDDDSDVWATNTSAT